MQLKEFAALPGGWIAVTLFRLGFAVVLISAIIWGLTFGLPGNAEFGSGAWIFLVWGVTSVSFALALRKSKAKLLKLAALIWLAFGILLTMLVIFGTKITFLGNHYAIG
jgi:hypothetical protein